MPAPVTLPISHGVRGELAPRTALCNVPTRDRSSGLTAAFCSGIASARAPIMCARGQAPALAGHTGLPRSAVARAAVATGTSVAAMRQVSARGGCLGLRAGGAQKGHGSEKRSRLCTVGKTSAASNPGCRESMLAAQKLKPRPGRPARAGHRRPVRGCTTAVTANRCLAFPLTPNGGQGSTRVKDDSRGCTVPGLACACEAQRRTPHSQTLHP